MTRNNLWRRHLSAATSDSSSKEPMAAVSASLGRHAHTHTVTQLDSEMCVLLSKKKKKDRTDIRREAHAHFDTHTTHKHTLLHTLSVDSRCAVEEFIPPPAFPLILLLGNNIYPEFSGMRHHVPLTHTNTRGQWSESVRVCVCVCVLKCKRLLRFFPMPHYLFVCLFC